MIKDKFKQGKPVFSIEVFPPKKTADVATIYEALKEFKKLNPSFMSVTYGAGGSTSGLTADIATYIQNSCNISALSHLTCASLSSKEQLLDYINTLKKGNVKNILALRGDKPKEMSKADFDNRYYGHASDLAQEIKRVSDFCIAGACYPEAHPESLSPEGDLIHLKYKVEHGVDFLITQLFYDNDKFYWFLENARKIGITVPITAGIMPITAPSQVNNIIALSGCAIPKELQAIIDEYMDNPSDLKKAGLNYSKQQIEQLLAHGVDGIHIYSMNKVEIAQSLML